MDAACIFSALDTDGSGFIDPAEIDNALKRWGFDSDTERKAHRDALLSQMDLNGDGMIDIRGIAIA